MTNGQFQTHSSKMGSGIKENATLIARKVNSGVLLVGAIFVSTLAMITNQCSTVT